jgi:ABC-type multidrug transport system fused ATPase/permease subunit
LATGLGGCIYAFYTGKAYALTLIAYLPVFFIILGTFGIMVKKVTSDRLNVVKELGGVVSETLYAIKVVVSCGGELKEMAKFTEQANKIFDVGKRYHLRFSFMVAIMKFAIFSFYTFAFYVGARFIED